MTRTGTEFIIVDPDARTRAPAFDHVKVAGALSVALRRSLAPGGLPIQRLEAVGGEPLRLDVNGQTWLYDHETAEVTLTDWPGIVVHESLSPNGRFVAFIREHNLVVRELATGLERVLTHSGVEGHSIGTQPDFAPMRFVLEAAGLHTPPMLAWSPDSRRVVTHRIDERAVERTHYLQSSPADGGRPLLHSRRFAMVGELVPMVELIVIDVMSGKTTVAACPPFPITWYSSPFMLGRVWWDPQGGHVYFVSGNRGDRTIRLSALDPETGTVRVLVEETSETQIQTRPEYPGPPNARVLASGETIWWSERSGWGHLYIHAPDGSVQTLTAGDWVVCDLLSVDEDARIALFTGAGREAGLDPYVRQIYRVGLDDFTVKRLSQDVLDHEVTISPSGRSIVDVRSWVDTPSSSVVVDRNGETILELEQADAELLHRAGWSPPDRFVVKAADGATDLYGLMYRPHGFDPTSSYALVDCVYPGPQTHAASVRFGENGTAPAMAALGFAVVIVDGRGTTMRGKAFQEHCRENPDDNLDDHVMAIRQLAASHEWIDLERVGIYGASGGGRAATQGLLRHADFFKVAVAASGNHDDVVGYAFWGEKYVGLRDQVDYRKRANATYADQLCGKLLLIHGELDDNVPMYQTLRLVDALIAQNKDFELLIVPNGGHGVSLNDAYVLRRTWDFFVRHLLNAEPPGYRIAAIPLDIEALSEALGR